MIETQQLIPTIMIFFSLVSAIVYFIFGDLRHTIYWLSSAAIIASVTY